MSDYEHTGNTSSEIISSLMYWSAPAPCKLKKRIPVKQGIMKLEKFKLNHYSRISIFFEYCFL